MEQINENFGEREIKSGGFINELLWTCAGVNKRILRQCPTDYAKYAGIGGTILFTALMAMLSGGYAFYTIFEDIWTACFFGIFWGLLIFNLDRFMVNTMYSDGKHTISRDEFLGGIPRLILAIFLGVVISVPIEIRIFNDKIQSQLLIDKGKVNDDVRNANEELYNERNRIVGLISAQEDKLKELQSGTVNGYSSRIAEMEKSLKQAEDRLYEEVNGTGITRRQGYGPAAKQLQEQVDRMKAELADLRNQEKAEKLSNRAYIDRQIESTLSYMDELKRQLEVVNKRIDEVTAQGGKATDALTGFTARLQALSEITSYENSPSLYFARIMIMLLFITIEIIPTLFKMMVASGPYDDMLRAEMHRARVMADKRISDINDSINTEIQISTRKNTNRLEAEVRANGKVLEHIALAQAELIQVAIDAWREEELAKIQENPSAYIHTNMSEQDHAIGAKAIQRCKI